MNVIRNRLDVKTLWLTWQSSQVKGSRRFRVGMLFKNDSGYSFKYLTASEDFKLAKAQGFAGYPAFKISDKPYQNDVLYSFRKRLPPKSRRDFSKFLFHYGLPVDFCGDDFQLISHTGVRLPSDGFDLIPELSEAKIPFQYVMEVTGTRHHRSYEEVSSIEVGSKVELHHEPENLNDQGKIVNVY